MKGSIIDYYIFRKITQYRRMMVLRHNKIVLYYFFQLPKITLALIVILTVYAYSQSFSFMNQSLQYSKIFELESCPVCYGSRACPLLLSGLIKIDAGQSESATTFRAIMNFSEHILVKKLGDSKLIKQLNGKICKLADEPRNCIAKLAVYQLNQVRDLKSSLLSGDLFMCRSEEIVDRMLRSYTERKGHGMFSDLLNHAQLFSTLLVNKEPLFLQMFPAEEGWPFPSYFGACGRVVMVSYIGQSLDEYIDAPWEIRVLLAHNLLLLATRLTYSHPHFAIYWPRLQLSHISVTHSDGYQLFVTDLKDLVVAFRQGSQIVHAPSQFNCSGFSDSTCAPAISELCLPGENSINYLMSCRALLHATTHKFGFLQGLPDHIIDDGAIYKWLLMCSSYTNVDHFKAKDELISALYAIIQYQL